MYVYGPVWVIVTTIVTILVLIWVIAAFATWVT
jgi:hypothetical protein